VRHSLALLLAALLTAGSARAEDEPAAALTVSLTVDACVAVDAADVRKIVEIELHTATADAAPTRVSVQCREALIEIAVEDTITGKSLLRAVDLMGAAPKARARLLALAIAELVSASWTELETNPEPAVLPAGPPPRAAVRAAAREVARTKLPSAVPDREPPLVMAVLDRRAFLARTAWVTGLGVRVAEDGRLVGWSAEMIASQGARESDLGDVALDLVSVGIGATLGHRWSRVSLRGVAGARFGAARMSGVPRDEAIEGRSVRGPWGGPMLAGAASFRIVGPLVVEALLEGGYVIAPLHARADGVRVASIAGVFVGGSIALGVAL
jgi:hypothetical protein